MIAIVDYKMGNLRSVEKGFEHAGVEDARVTDDPRLIEAAFKAVARSLREAVALDERITDVPSTKGAL